MLAKRLRELRTMHHLTQKMVAEALGIDRTTYTVYETGTSTPSAATLFKLSQIYHVTVGYLMGVEEDPSKKAAAQETTLSSGDSMLQSLRDDERQLIMHFRLLPEDKKKIALQMLRALSEMENGVS